MARVWKALTDHEEFGAWFRVKLEGPFTPGEMSRGAMTYPGHEGAPWLAMVEQMDPERLFSFRWHDFDPDSGTPVEEQPTMHVEFRRTPTEAGTRLTITETGFSSIPNPRRMDVMRRNTEGWDIQAQHIAAHVGG